MAEFLWIFWSFSLLGWGLERLFAAVTRSPQRRRRCLLLLPLCPVYGLGMAAVLALPPSLRSGWPLYLWGGLTATSVEYIYHWWGETFLSVSFWDYTGVFGNLRGRVCLPFSLAWGLLLFPAVYLVTPPVLALADLPETAAEADSGAAELWDAVAHLPEKLRVPIHLYYAEGYSTEEIAGLLDIPAATVRTRLRRARKRLKDLLGGDDHEEERLSEFDGAYPAPRRAE